MFSKIGSLLFFFFSPGNFIANESGLIFMCNRVTLLTSKVSSDLKEKYVLVVFQLLVNIPSALLSFPQCISQLIIKFPS